MQTRVYVEKGKVVKGNSILVDVFSSLMDGYYDVSVTGVNPLITERDYQNAYFAMIDVCARHAGNTRYDVHDYFKDFIGKKLDDANISTKSLDIPGWRNWNEEFRWWAFNNYDCVV